MHLNLIPLAVNVSRVFEIARVGNFNVKLITNELPQPINPKDLELVREFYGFPKEAPNPDMIVELCFNHNDILNVITGSRGESMDDLLFRIAKVEEDSIIVDRTLNEPCKRLLKSALEKLELGLHDAITIIDIAVAIARLGQSETIKVEHLAEAIQYKSIK